MGKGWRQASLRQASLPTGGVLDRAAPSCLSAPFRLLTLEQLRLRLCRLCEAQHTAAAAAPAQRAASLALAATAAVPGELAVCGSQRLAALQRVPGQRVDDERYRASGGRQRGAQHEAAAHGHAELQRPQREVRGWQHCHQLLGPGAAAATHSAARTDGGAHGARPRAVLVRPGD